MFQYVLMTVDVLKHGLISMLPPSYCLMFVNIDINMREEVCRYQNKATIREVYGA